MTRDEMKAKILEGVYEDLMPDPPKPKPKPKLEAEVLPFPPLLNEQELVRRQEILDQQWIAHLEAQRELDEEPDPEDKLRDETWAVEIKLQRQAQRKQRQHDAVMKVSSEAAAADIRWEKEQGKRYGDE